MGTAPITRLVTVANKWTHIQCRRTGAWTDGRIFLPLFCKKTISTALQKWSKNDNSRWLWV